MKMKFIMKLAAIAVLAINPMMSFAAQVNGDNAAANVVTITNNSGKAVYVKLNPGDDTKWCYPAATNFPQIEKGGSLVVSTAEFTDCQKYNSGKALQPYSFFPADSTSSWYLQVKHSATSSVVVGPNATCTINTDESMTCNSGS